MDKRVTALIIMDGFGKPKDISRSAILEENTKHIREYANKYPSTLIYASELQVGLPEGQAGTSEVGHLTIGSGRVVLQPLVRVNKAIEDGSIRKNKVLVEAMQIAKSKALHLLGMPTDGGIHSHINHLLELLEMAKENGVEKVYIHVCADGRDTPPKSIKKYISIIENKCKELGVGEISTIIGRAWALDRDKNFDRNKIAYEAMVSGVGKLRENALDAVEEAYNEGETDEFIKPIVMAKNGEPVGLIQKGDVVISYNFRADRERQLQYVFVEPNELDFVKNLDLHFVTMTNYDENMTHAKIAFDNIPITDILSQKLSEKGYRQLKIAETEKYAHVTFFFNAGKQDTFKNEERMLVNSPKLISYALKPEMSAYEVCDKTVDGILSGKYDFVAVNFANCDMVGHSGDKEAAKKAVAVVDECVDKVIKAVLSVGGHAIITADHGNADIMQYEDGTKHTAHTTNMVPCIVVDDELIGLKLREGGNLSDIAPTILDMMGEEKPVEMTGESLIIKW